MLTKENLSCFLIYFLKLSGLPDDMLISKGIQMEGKWSISVIYFKKLYTPSALFKCTASQRPRLFVSELPGLKGVLIRR